MDSQGYLKVEIPVPDEDIGDIIVAAFSEIGFDGFEYGDGTIECYIQNRIFDEDRMIEVLSMLVVELDMDFDYTISAVPDNDWNSEWEKSAFTPIEYGDYIVVPYDEGEYHGTKTPIYLHPHLAFGDGHHQTTGMMMEAMLAIKDSFPGASVMDLGCGTAVLAIMAAKMGAASVSAVDINETAVRSAMENLELNGEHFPVLCGDSSLLEPQAYDIILANIHRNVLIDDMPVYRRSLRDGGYLIISGFFAEDIPDILSAAADNGIRVADIPSATLVKDIWHAIILTR